NNWIVCHLLGALFAAGEVFHTKTGKRVTLECGFNSIAKNQKWSRGSQQIISDDADFRKYVPLGQRSSLRANNLVISSVTKKDAGTFTCEADHYKKEHTLLVVSVWTSPHGILQVGSNAVLQCNVSGLNPGSTVQWKKPDGSLAANPVHLSPVALSHNGIWACSFSHYGQHYSETLQVMVYASSAKSSRVDPTTPCPVCTDVSVLTSVEQLDWWVWVTVAVGSLAVVLLMVLIIVLVNRIRRRKVTKENYAENLHLFVKTSLCSLYRSPAAAAKPQQGRRKEKPSALLMESHESQIKEKRDSEKARMKE
uniref:Ig-like domain-containing protein n=1 Tax=Monopterus albus TaxID=43700 RepID=A0A3Q3KRW5_MONAL